MPAGQLLLYNSTYQDNWFINMAALTVRPKFIFPIILITIFLVGVVFWRSQSSPKAREVNEQTISQNQRFLNGPAHFRAQTNSEFKAIDQNEARANLERQIRIETEAAKLGIKVTDQEISAKKQALVAASSQETIDQQLQGYGWTDQDWTELIKGQLLQEKLTNRLTTYREIQYVTVSWPEAGSEAEARTYLETVNKGSQDQIVAIAISKDAGALRREFGPPPGADQSLVRIRAEDISEVGKTALTLKKDQSKISCGDKSCTLVKVYAANDGQYQSMEDFLGGDLPW